MKVYVSCRSKASAKKFGNRHPFLRNAALLTDLTSPVRLLNQIITEETQPCLLMRDDVYVDSGFPQRLAEGLEILNSLNPGWGVAGNSGIGLCMYGMEPSAVVRYVSDGQGGPNLPARILPAQSLDGNTLLLNVPLLRQKGVRLPELECSRLYDLLLCMEAARARLGCYIIPQLLLYNDSYVCPQDYMQDAACPGFKKWASRTLAYSTLFTLNGAVHVKNPSGNLRMPDDGLKNCVKRDGPVVSIIIRTRFERPRLLWRAAQTANAFIAASGMQDMYQLFIVSDLEAGDLPLNTSFRHFIPDEPLDDSRLFLIRKTVEEIESDYFWFLDDDDWMFPNMAGIISMSINSSPKGSTFHIGCRHFIEDNSAGVYPDGQSRVQADQFFDPKQFASSLYGFNAIPFCGLVFPSESLRAVFRQNDFANILYYEDYCLQLLNMYLPAYFPVVIDVLATGISVRTQGNTITAADRTGWHLCGSAMFWQVAQKANMLISRSSIPAPSREEIMYGLPFADLKMLLRRKFVNKIQKIKSIIKGWLMSS